MILSDGEDNAGALPAPDAALLASDRGVVRIHAVGLADAEGRWRQRLFCARSRRSRAEPSRRLPGRPTGRIWRGTDDRDNR